MPVGRIEAQDPGQVRPLVPELGPQGELVEHEVHDLSRRHRRPLVDAPEAGRGDVPGEDPGVVPGALDGARVRRDAVLLQPGRPLSDRPGKEDPGHRGALPDMASGPAGGSGRTSPHQGRAGRGGARRSPVAAITSSASKTISTESSDRRVTTRNGAPSASPRSIRSIAASRIATPPPEDVVLVRLDVARPDPDERVGVDRQLGRRRRGDHDPLRPRQHPAGQLEARVLLADDEDPPVGVLLDRARIGVVRGELHPRARRSPRLRYADREDERPGGIRPVARLELEAAVVEPAGRRSSGSRSGSAAPVRLTNASRPACISGRLGK